MNWSDLFKGRKKLNKQKAVIDYIDMAILERASYGEVPMSTLEKVFNLTTKARVKHTDKLLKKGLVEIRRGTRKDHRNKYINITDKGKVLFDILKGGK